MIDVGDDNSYFESGDGERVCEQGFVIRRDEDDVGSRVFENISELRCAGCGIERRTLAACKHCTEHELGSSRAVAEHQRYRVALAEAERIEARCDSIRLVEQGGVSQRPIALGGDDINALSGIGCSSSDERAYGSIRICVSRAVGGVLVCAHRI